MPGIEKVAAWIWPIAMILTGELLAALRLPELLLPHAATVTPATTAATAVSALRIERLSS
jgi:hypothetical protein